jgi:hypothetical protein
MARVDPYLTAGCDVCLDTEAMGLASLERVQVGFLRRMLGVGRRSLKGVLFSETGIWPIRYRRVYLSLKYMCYLLTLDYERPASNALQETLLLARDQKLCWMNDLRILLWRLYIPVNLDISGEINVQTVEAPMEFVVKSMEAWIDNEINSSSREASSQTDSKKTLKRGSWLKNRGPSAVAGSQGSHAEIVLYSFLYALLIYPRITLHHLFVL